MSSNLSLIQRICDDKEFAEIVWEMFDDAYESDCEKPSRKFMRIAHQYLGGENALIDDILITLCGWSLQTLAELAVDQDDKNNNETEELTQ